MSNDTVRNPYERLWKLEAAVNKLVLDGKRDPRKVADVLQVVVENADWREEDGVIYFSVTSDGATGEQWIQRLEGNGCPVIDYAKQLLCSPDFKPTSGITNEVVVLRGCLFNDDDRFTKMIRAEGAVRNLLAPNAELACLICEKFLPSEIEAMGLWYVVIMHEPINNSNGVPYLLVPSRDSGRRLLYAYSGRPNEQWSRDFGFAFAVSQARPTE